jgi:hypothetical protein
MQDKGLPICPECADELHPIVRIDKRMVAVVTVAALLVISVGGTLGYGMAIKDLSMGQTVQWVFGKLTLPDSLMAPGFRSEWLRGTVLWQFKGGHEPKGFSHSFLCEQRADEYWCQPRSTPSSGDRMQFELLPQVENLYVFYRDPQGALMLYPKNGSATVPAGQSIRVPQGEEMQLSGGHTTEVFLIVAARKPVPQLAGLPQGPVPLGKLDEAVKPLLTDKDCLVMYVQVPHV